MFNKETQSCKQHMVIQIITSKKPSLVTMKNERNRRIVVVNIYKQGYSSCISPHFIWRYLHFPLRIKTRFLYQNIQLVPQLIT